MMKSFFCAALMLAACNVALARELKTLVLIKTNALAKPDAVAPTGDNVAVAQRKVAMATGGAKPVVPASACDNTKSPSNVVVNSGITFKATLSGAKNIKPNTTGVLMPAPGPSSGTYTLLLDESGKRASWTLELWDTPAYVASHLHTGSSIADFAPPLVPLEPYVKPANPFAPPNLLPQLCPPVDIKGCSYTAKGSFSDADITPLLGREPRGDKEAPSVTSLADFVRVLKDGKIYVNVHSKVAPAGLMRGNLQRQN